MSTRYVVEVVSKPKAKCMTCKDVIGEGEMRMGIETAVADSGRKSTKWRHWRCVGSRVLTNVGEMDKICGLEQLGPEHQEVVRQAFAERESGKKTPAAPKRPRAPRKSSKKKAEEYDSEEEAADELSEEENEEEEQEAEAAAEEAGEEVAEGGAAEETFEVPAALQEEEEEDEPEPEPEAEDDDDEDYVDEPGAKRQRSDS